MSAPFIGQQFTFIQPDGSELWVRGWGTQEQAVFEGLNGYTVVKDPETGYYVYAELSPDGGALRPTALQPRISPVKPKGAGLVSGVRVDPKAARATLKTVSRKNKSRWEQRREEVKEQRRRIAEMAARELPPLHPADKRPVTSPVWS